MSESTSLRRTPFHDIHVALGAKIVPFAGYEMPVQYPAGITAEHKAVRESCGLFDVSHMGEFLVRGPGAVDFVNYVTTNDVAKLAIGQVHYSGILNDQGTFEDDCLVYREADRILMVVNASNAAKDFAHISRHLGRFDCTLEDISDQIALLALQGPKAASILQPLTDVTLGDIKYYHFSRGTVAGVKDVYVSRTGYTGEDGFELYFPNAHAATIWQALMAGGQVSPAGLGCRDSLRLEMGMALYGNDIDETTNPLEAGLSWVVRFDKADFIGRSALLAVKEAGLARKLVGFEMTDKAIARDHWQVINEADEQVGYVTSGSPSPTLGKNLGLAYVPTASSALGSTLRLRDPERGRVGNAVVVKTPFYKRAR